MFIWLASYPKSGNTLVRSMLSAYFFSKYVNYNFELIKNIKQFPHGGFFLKMGIDINNQNETVKNYIKAQESFNKNFPFTNFNNTLGVIYIVRDPRNVVTSFAKFKSLSVEKTADFMISGVGDGLVWTNNWSVNYHSWKLFKEYKRYLLIKYEDLISKPDKTFLNILEFIHKLNKTIFELDKNKFENVIKTTSFDSMQKLEKEKGFTESWVDKKTGKKIPFFYLGPKNDWKKKLDTKIAEKLEKAFKSEMEELGYI